jgi:phosphoenolpyruvate-protein phosphotransferase
MQQVMGILTSGGGPTSHSAILARGLGIPAISGLSAEFERLKDGVIVAMNGFTGDVWIDPEEKIIQDIKDKREEWLNERERLLEASSSPAATKDGTRVEVVANVGSVQDAEAALNNGAEGIGLLRTEFLFLNSQGQPTEDDQYAILREIGEAISSNGDIKKPVVVRTLDVGGDKDLPYLDLPVEDNPFLGVRAIRMSLRNPQVFLTQLRAVLRAGEGLNVKIMFPMVANLEEVKQAKALLEEAHHSLVTDKVKHKWPIETGIMVEIPAAALLSAELANYVDFFSIGTNDLTQYTMAAERGNPELSHLNDAMHPAVLKLIDQVTKAAHSRGKWVGVCGELAGDPIAAPVLIGLGVDELSMNPGSIPRTKVVLKSISLHETVELAQLVLNAVSSDAARLAAKNFLEDRNVGN